jgi:hypothetical protein
MTLHKKICIPKRLLISYKERLHISTFTVYYHIKRLAEPRQMHDIRASVMTKSARSGT